MGVTASTPRARAGGAGAVLLTLATGQILMTLDSSVTMSRLPRWLRTSEPPVIQGAEYRDVRSSTPRRSPARATYADDWLTENRSTGRSRS